MTSLQQWQEQGDTFSFNGNDIFYLTKGDKQKPALVLIHGFPTCSWDWAKIFPALNEQFYLITLDMLGFGFSDKPKQDYSIFEQADIFDALLSQLNIKQYHLLAHDYGDTVAQELLARHHKTGQILSVVFSNGGLFPETHHPVLLQKLLLSPIGFILSKLVRYEKFKINFDHICAKNLSEDELKGYWQMLEHKGGVLIMHKLIAYMIERKQNRERWVGVMQTTDVPMMLIDGLLDPISGAHMVARYEELIPNPHIVKLEDTGHYPQVESPTEFVNGVLKFLQAQ
ncbi:alpha/beta fold hydrolase [Pseudomonas sp. HK3]